MYIYIYKYIYIYRDRERERLFIQMESKGDRRHVLFRWPPKSAGRGKRGIKGNKGG